MISFDISVEDGGWEEFELETILMKCASSLSDTLGKDLPRGEVSVLFADDAAVQALNRDWRGKDKPTNVLSFPAEDFPEIEGLSPPLGDIALAFETCQREAVEKEIPVSEHLTHLILHGILHLLGYDHIEDEEATEMEDLERQLLAHIGIADPYGPADDGESDA